MEESILGSHYCCTAVDWSGVFLSILILFWTCSCSLAKYNVFLCRFPQLHVIGFQCSSNLSADEKSDMMQFIMREYISFPILLSNNIFEVRLKCCFFCLTYVFRLRYRMVILLASWVMVGTCITFHLSWVSVMQLWCD